MHLLFLEMSYSFPFQNFVLFLNTTTFLFSWILILFLLFSCSVMSKSLRPHGFQHARVPCPLPSSGVCSYSYLLSQWCHPTISFSVVDFSSCLQSFPDSGSFRMSQFFALGGQSIGVSASETILPMILRAQLVRNLPVMQETLVWFLGQENPLEKG